MIVRNRIPNNVDLDGQPKLARALLAWQPAYLGWWRQMGPDGFQEAEVWLRTPTSVDACGWAHFDYVRMPEYRWGLFLAEPEAERVIPCGDHYGSRVWQEPPEAYRSMLFRLIRIQADTEPASVEMQRHLGHTAPSLYDLRNLFQVNVEEGRHLWAMVYLLHRYFGPEGRDEAAALLHRRSGCATNGRVLETFNAPIETWLDFYMFTMFGDRDGKYQLAALSESGFDPLARSCRFMLTEEAHHLFVGVTGVERVIKRTAELMQQGLDVRANGAIPLEIIQRYINHWFSCCLDLFGREISRGAGDFFGAGLKGRYREGRCEDHCGSRATMRLMVPQSCGALREQDVPLRNAMNEVLRQEYIADCEKALARWNRVLTVHGQRPVLQLPHRRFNRQIGLYAGHRFAPCGMSIEEQHWCAQQSVWLPTPADRAYVASLMQPVTQPGKVAGWVAPPSKGVRGTPLDYEYVRL